jgi:hypothetical protein
VIVMDEKRCILVLAVVVLTFLLFAKSVSANFVCGSVVGDDVNPAWFEVNVWYSERPDSYTTCLVSPEEGKYCCDPEEIDDVQWAVGKEVNAQIVERGFATQTESLIISGEGFDVFPDLTLEKSVVVHEPAESIYLKNRTVLVNVSSSGGFNNISYLLDQNGVEVEGEICSDCNHAEFYLENLDFGQYELRIFAENSEGNVLSETRRFALLEYINFEREFVCEDCEDDIVPSNTNVKVVVRAESSHEISGTLKDYFPVSWKFFGGGDVEEFSKTHNVVRWDVSGREFEEVYELRTPRVFIPRRFTFQSGFNDFLAEPERVVVKWLWSFFALSRELDRNITDRDFFIGYEKILPEAPLVIDFSGENLAEIAIFPKGEMDEVYGFVHDETSGGLFGYDGEFVIGSSAAEEEIDDILIRLRVEKRGGIENVVLYRFDSLNEEWLEYEMDLYNEDSEFGYYETYVDNKGAFAFTINYE